MNDRSFTAIRPVWRDQIATMLALLMALLLQVLPFMLGFAVELRYLLLALGVIFTAGLAALLLYRHYSHVYYIEKDRVEHRIGIISRDVTSVRLEDLRNINMHQTIWQRLLLMGTLEFSSAGGSGIEVVWRGISHPATVKNTIENMRRPPAE